MQTKEKIQLVRELHKPIRKNFPRRRTIIKGLNDLWQADLAQMDLFSKDNKNFKYILVVIDCFSKFVRVRALKTKTGVEVSNAFKEILLDSRVKPKNLQTDQGKEFYNVNFQSLMKENDIIHYCTYSKTKASIAERVIRTIKEKLFKYFSLHGTYKWIDILSSIVNEYNHTKHRTIGIKPCDVSRKMEQSLLKTRYNHIKIAGKGKFMVNDMVRISKAKHVFSKGYTPNWTTEIFKIKKVQITNPVTYLLEDLNGRPIGGAFYEYELQKTKYPDVFLVEKVIRRKGNKALVRWLGFDKSHDSWIDSTNIL